MVRPGGRILIGEGYWRQEPSPGYLAATPFEAHHLTSHAANIELGEGAGLTLLHASTSTLEEWDHFEGLFWQAAEDDLAAQPDDPDAQGAASHCA